jgi:hypothetical protein
VSPRETRPARPWEGPILTTALLLGLVLMGLQLWLLTVALDLLLGGKTHGFLGLALASGAVFAGGLVVLWLLRASPPGPA